MAGRAGNGWTGGREETTTSEQQAPVTASTTVTVALAAAAKAADENFPVALRMLPGRYRQQLMALYSYARLVDDIGDEPLPAGEQPAGEQPAGQQAAGRQAAAAEVKVRDNTPAADRQARLQLLDDLAAEVARCYDPAAPEPQLDVLRGVRQLAQQAGAPRQYFDDLIQANRQDQLVTRYRNYEELEQYCVLSANPVGRVVLHIFGVANTERSSLSDNICTALQLVEHWQDVAEDLRNGRVYLPQEDLDRFGCAEADLAKPSAGPNLRKLMAFEVERASKLLDDGASLVGTLRGAARLAVAGYVAGGRAALHAIKDSGYDVLSQTRTPGKARTVAELIRCYLRGR